MCIRDRSFPTYVSAFVVKGGDFPRIIATSSSMDTKELTNINALNYPLMDPSLLLGSFQGESKELLVEDVNRSSNTLHYAVPIMGKNSDVLGSLYMVASLSSVYSVLGLSLIHIFNFITVVTYYINYLSQTIFCYLMLY